MKRMTQEMTKRLLTLLTACSLLAPSLANAQRVEYYHVDALGSVRAVTDEQGDLLERHDYLPFGEEWNPQPSGQPRKFTGKERDQETGWDYFGARYYESSLARFTSIDPVITFDENRVDPQRWNRYSYVRNNPLRYVDPDGKIVDTVLDAVFIAYDIYDIGSSLVGGEQVSGTQWAALGADFGGLLIPFGTGGGVAVRAAARADDVIDMAGTVSRAARGGSSPVRVGQAGEQLAGVTRAKTRIPSATGTAQYRVPDELTATSLREVKNVQRLRTGGRAGNQLRDYSEFARAQGLTCELCVRDSTKISTRSQQILDDLGFVVNRELP